MKLLSRQAVAELKKYFDSATVHGVSYFVAEIISPMERFFWIAITIVMFGIGSNWVNNLRLTWDNNPTKIVTASSSFAASEVQFPTVTVCNSFAHDRWGFVRDILNLIKFECNSAEDCLETAAARSFFTKIPDVRTIQGDYFPLSIYKQAIKDLKSAKIGTFHPQEHWDYDFEHSFFMAEAGGTAKMMEFAYRLLSKFQNQSSSIQDVFMDRMIELKLTGQQNNYGFLDELLAQLDTQVESNIQAGNVPKSYEKTKSPSFAALDVMATLLSFPMPGRLGTIFATFMSTHAKEQKVNFPGRSGWYFPTLNYSNALYSIDTLPYLTSLMNNMANDPNLNIGPFDLAPLLAPVTTYTSKRKQSNQFPFTVQQQTWKTEPNYLYYKDACDHCDVGQVPGLPIAASHWTRRGSQATAEPPQFLLEDNYFGKLLGPHLLTVMEIMAHGILSPKRLPRNWNKDLPELYSRLSNWINFPHNKDSGNPAFQLSMKDFNSNITSYMPLKESAQADDNKGEKRNDAVLSFDAYFEGENDNVTVQDITYKDDILNYLARKFHPRQLMDFCIGPGDRQSCEENFEPVLTETGICFAFNSKTFDDTMRTTRYTEMFQKVFKPSATAKDILKNELVGRNFQLFIILDSHQSDVYDPVQGEFTIGINQDMDFFSMLDEAIAVPVGYHTQIKVNPVSYGSSASFKSLSRSQRQCRYPDEHDEKSSIFKFYSQKSCKFECRLRQAEKECGCIPWDYPQLDENIELICDGIKTACFQNAMKGYNETSCQCDPDCEGLVFAISENKFKIDSDTICDLNQENTEMNQETNDFGKNYHLPDIIGEKVRHTEGAEYQFWMDKVAGQNFQIFDDRQKRHKFLNDLFLKNRYIRYTAPELIKDLCKQLVENDLAFLTIEQSSAQLTRFEREVSFSFEDKLGILGGTIGLFTGMSLLSMVEAAFWFLRILWIPIRGKSKKSQGSG